MRIFQVWKGAKRSGKVGKGEAELPREWGCNSGIAFFSREISARGDGPSLSGIADHLYAAAAPEKRWREYENRSENGGSLLRINSYH